MNEQKTTTAIRAWLIVFIVGLVVAGATAFPLAAIAGPIRGIPFGWELIDMSFGVVGIVPLLLVYRLVRRLEKLQSERARLELAGLERARLEQAPLDRACPDTAPLDGSPRAAAAAGS